MLDPSFESEEQMRDNDLVNELCMQECKGSEKVLSRRTLLKYHDTGCPYRLHKETESYEGKEIMSKKEKRDR